VKEETRELPEIENHQDESIITYIDKIYKESFSKFIYFRWIVKLVVPIIGKSAKTVGQCKFPRVQAQCTIKYIPTSKFIYFRWIAKPIALVVEKNAKIVGQCRFLKAQAQCTIRYTPTTCTSTIDEDLD
jgi:hypothetical protein